jgi:hypothetical protein
MRGVDDGLRADRASGGDSDGVVARLHDGRLLEDPAAESHEAACQPADVRERVDLGLVVEAQRAGGSEGARKRRVVHRETESPRGLGLPVERLRLLLAGGEAVAGQSPEAGDAQAPAVLLDRADREPHRVRDDPRRRFTEARRDRVPRHVECGGEVRGARTGGSRADPPALDDDDGLARLREPHGEAQAGDACSYDHRVDAQLLRERRELREFLVLEPVRSGRGAGTRCSLRASHARSSRARDG